MFKKFLISQIVVAVILTMFLTFMSTSPVAFATANIYWETTNVVTENGRALVSGYFYNTGDSTGTVTDLILNGYIGNVSINAPFRNVTYLVMPGRNVTELFTIRDGRFSHNRSPQWSIDYSVSFNK